MSPIPVAEQPHSDGALQASPISLLDDARQFQLLINSVVDYAIYMLDSTGRIASWNPGGLRIKGYRADEVIGRHFSIFYTPEDLATGEPQRALKMAAESGKYEKEGWRMRKDGSRFWASVVIDPVIRDGQLIGFAKITRDVTERRKAQQALEDAQSALLQSQKMEAIGQLTYGLAHDFNNLLTIIANGLDTLAVETDPARIRRTIATTQRATDRGALLTRQLLAFSRGQMLRPKPHNLSALIGDATDLLRRACDETISVEFALDPQLPKVAIDASQFEAALLNLVVNARDAMPKGGRIHIETRRQARRNGEGDEVSVTITDSGTGMSPEIVARATEPFFTTKEVGKGSGLGLSQVYGFVAQSQGEVEIHSQPGAGTTVVLRLPALQLEADVAAEEPLRVLMVDDDPNIVEIVSDALRDAGYQVLTASDGATAIALLQEHDIHVLFSDVVMPGGMSGVDLARHAIAINPGLKILLASGYSEGWLKDVPESCEFIAKPYRAARLLEALHEHRARLRGPPR